MKHLFVTIFTTVLLTIAASLLMATNARADQISNASFKQIVRIFEEPSDDVVGQILFDLDEGINTLDPEMRERFDFIATRQAGVWGDTILEGDYHADGKTRLDRVEELKLNGVLAGYRIVYSELAWDTASCELNDDFSGQADELSQCTEGRIQEASFVAPDLKDWTTDNNAYAEFLD